MQYHPDRVRDKTDAEKEEAKVRFELIQKAYDHLSDPEKRKAYDSTGFVSPSQEQLYQIARDGLIKGLVQTVEKLMGMDHVVGWNGITVSVHSPVSVLHQELTNKVALMDMNRKNLLKRIKSAEKMLKRFSNKKTKSFDQTPVGVAINNSIRNMNLVLFQMDLEKKVTDLVLEMLDDYEYDTSLQSEVSSSAQEPQQPFQISA